MKPTGYGRPTALDATFAALADPTRRAILARLALGDASVTELAEPFAMTQPAISKHLKVLESAGLISRGREAQRRPRRLEAKPLAEASGWLETYRQFWEGSYQRLDALLEELKRKKKDGGRAHRDVEVAGSGSTHSRARRRRGAIADPSQFLRARSLRKGERR
jgi:DNA-binding transcriptional ArsR family regulator